MSVPFRQHLHLFGGLGGWRGESVIVTLILSTFPSTPTPLWRTKRLERRVSDSDTDPVYLSVNTYTSVEDKVVGEASQ